MTVASNLGFPRIGRRRELKAALERHWAGAMDAAGLEQEAARLRRDHWRVQQGAGISHVPSGDFSLYDHVLDTACLCGAVPAGYGWQGGAVSLPTYFGLARGSGASAPALEMTKWFDTNYHYLVPVLSAGQRFELTGNRPLAMFLEAQAAAIRTRPVLLGPVSFLLLCKTTDGSDPLDRLPELLPIYRQVLRELAEAGCAWVQIDEPCLALDFEPRALAALAAAYAALSGRPRPDLLLATYFGALGDHLPEVFRLPVEGVHLDLVRGAGDLPAALQAAPPELWLSLGLIDGRNIWRADLRTALATAERVAAARGGARQLMIAPSCSLLHVPVDLAQEDRIDPELLGWMAFAVQKLAEVTVIARALDEGAGVVKTELEAADAALASRRESARVHRLDVAARLAAAAAGLERRDSPYAARRPVQQARLRLPPFPTTTIGSLPQTAEIRGKRAALAGDAGQAAEYESWMRERIAEAVRWQEEAGLDVLVHGEFERNDMVKYFGERLAGFAFTRHGWVQSYGSRCVAPPIIWADVARDAPITVAWSAYAQSLTDRPMKGMLTGPVTMLQWSFVRDDLSREQVCRQIALAIRDEVADLDMAGLPVIQVDEPAFREGLPLRRSEWEGYLRWATACFRLATSCVRDDTAIHTHMCYSEFNDIVDAVAEMDADAISIETARSRMTLLEAFGAESGRSYPAEIGPGIWDIHSPLVPSVEAICELLDLAQRRLAAWQIWVNPDCGLKTRRWEEVRPAIANLVAAAHRMRAAAGSPVSRT